MAPGADCGGRGDFVQVADRELRAVDLVPDAFFVERRRLDVYATFDDPPTGGTSLFPPDAGACVCFQREGAQRPGHCSPEDRLRTIRHVPAADVVPQRQEPEPGLMLVLGLRFEQVLVEVTNDHWRQDVARALHMHTGDLVVHEQDRIFERLAVMARLPSRVVAVKSFRVFGRRPPGFGIFIDGRSAGTPVCYRTCHAARISADDVARLLEVEVPDGYAATIGFSGCTAIGAEFLQTVHGAGYVFWLSFFVSDSSSRASGESPTDGPDDPPQGSADDDSFADDGERAEDADRPRAAADSGQADGRSRSPKKSREVDDGGVAFAHRVVSANLAVRGVATPCRNLSVVSPHLGCGPNLERQGSTAKPHAQAPLWMPGFHDDALAQCHQADTPAAERCEIGKVTSGRGEEFEAMWAPCWTWPSGEKELVCLRRLFAHWHTGDLRCYVTDRSAFAYSSIFPRQSLTLRGLRCPFEGVCKMSSAFAIHGSDRLNASCRMVSHCTQLPEKP